MKVPNLLKTMILTATVGAVVWTGTPIIDSAIGFLKSADQKIISANEGITLLKSDISSKKDQIETLKAEIEDLKSQLESNSGSAEQIEQLQQQLQEKTEQLAQATEELNNANEEKTRLLEELNNANEDVQRLNTTLEEMRSGDINIPTVEEIKSFIAENGELTNEKITFTLFSSASGTTGQKEQEFINNNGDKISYMLTSKGISVKNISIVVQYTGYDFNLIVTGATAEAKTQLTKSNIQSVIGGSYTISNITFR